MEKDRLFANLKEAVISFNEEGIPLLTQQVIAAGLNPVEAIEKGLRPAIEIVGERFSRGEAFLPELILAAQTMKAAIKILQVEIKLRNLRHKTSGCVMLGVVRGDIHDIGKNILAALLETSGFEVIDLGIDVPENTFVEKVREEAPDILGISAFISTTKEAQRKTINAIINAGLRNKVKILVGGTAATAEWAQEIQADGYADNAGGAIKLMKDLLITKIP